MTPRTLEDEIQSRDIDPEVAAFLNVIRTADLFSTEFQRFLKPHGVTLQQFNVLRILRGAGDIGLPCLEISSRMVTRVPDVTRLVDRMERSELVTRARSEKDRRVVRVLITPKGRTIAEDLLEPLKQLHREQISGLTDAEVTTLNTLLEKTRQR